LALASINNSGSTTIVLMNKNNSKENFNYIEGDKNLNLSIPARSIVTLVSE